MTRFWNQNCFSQLWSHDLSRDNLVTCVTLNCLFLSDGGRIKGEFVKITKRVDHFLFPWSSLCFNSHSDYEINCAREGLALGYSIRLIRDREL